MYGLSLEVTFVLTVTTVVSSFIMFVITIASSSINVMMIAANGITVVVALIKEKVSKRKKSVGWVVVWLPPN
jgi:ribosomal silencing factor RsfS